MIIAKIFFELNEWICLPPFLLEKFIEFLENVLLGKVRYIHLKSPNESLIKLKIMVILYLNLTGIVNMQLCRAAQSGKAVWEKHLVQLLSFIPKFVSRGVGYWTSRLLWV